MVIPNAEGLTVVFSPASATLNSKSTLTIAPWQSALGSTSRSSKAASAGEDESCILYGPDKQKWISRDFHGIDALTFTFQTDAAGSAEERFGFTAAVLPMQASKDTDMLGKLGRELESINALMITNELETREANKSKQRPLFPVLLSVMKEYALAGEVQQAAELLHSMLVCLGRSTWLESGDTEIAESLGLQSAGKLLRQVMSTASNEPNFPKEVQASTVFDAWLEEIRAAYQSRSQDAKAWELAFPIVAQVGPCLEDLQMHILGDCLSKLETMRAAITRASKQYSLAQARLRYHACDQLSLLIASRKLPEGIQLVQSCHPYMPLEHSFDVVLDVAERSEVLVAFASCSCSFDRETKVVIQGQTFSGPGPWSLEPVKLSVKSNHLKVGFKTDGDGHERPERRWGFLALLADSRSVSVSNLAKAAEKIAETMAETADAKGESQLYLDALEAEAALGKAIRGGVQQLDEILASVGNPANLHRGAEDACKKLCFGLASMCKWLDEAEFARVERFPDAVEAEVPKLRGEYSACAQGRPDKHVPVLQRRGINGQSWREAYGPVLLLRPAD